MKYTLTVNIEGMSVGDLELALEEVRSQVSQGFTSGGNSNDTGEYNFEIEEDTYSAYLTRDEAIEDILDQWTMEAIYEDPNDPLDREGSREILEAKTDEEIKREYDECEAYKDREVVIIQE